MPGATFEPFDIVVTPFPFTERPVAKRRPSLVLSSAPFNRDHDHLVLAMITSAVSGEWPSDVRLRDWAQAELRVPCRVRLKLFTLANSLILRRLGALSDRDRKAVGASLSLNLAFR